MHLQSRMKEPGTTEFQEVKQSGEGSYGIIRGNSILLRRYNNHECSLLHHTLLCVYTWTYSSTYTHTETNFITSAFYMHFSKL